jgi:hypothetical protein
MVLVDDRGVERLICAQMQAKRRGRGLENWLRGLTTG